ncbi:hypothetical protein [Pseudoalteromonas phage XCL1123]|nr:hypothetical protein [Pseudoalteromonas phage XCL1123]
MKVNVTKAGHYIKLEGVLTELKTGEQDIEDKTASSMVSNGYAVKVESEPKKPENKKPATKK